MIKCFVKIFLLFVFYVSLPSCNKTPQNVAKLNPMPDQALQHLIEGNKRYVEERSIHRDETEKRRESTLNKQEPFAIIIGCSDSRVPPEIIFDQGLGNLFVVRVAGNVVGPIERDSIEFAAVQLKVPLIMVLGHQNCGAVNGVINGKSNEDKIEDIAPLIQPAVEKAKTLSGDLLTNSILENVKLVVAQLKADPALSPLIQSQNLKVVGGYYKLDKGDISILP